jgi:hypothetical protein
MNTETATRSYAEFFASLTPESLAELDRFFDPNVRFRDPFNDVTGLTAVHRIFDDMFERTLDPCFEIAEILPGSSFSYIRWHFHFAAPMLGRRTIEGVSRIAFNDAFKVTEHVDFWDAASGVYEALPLAGPVIRVLRRKLKA